MDDAREALTLPAFERHGLRRVRRTVGGYTRMERWIVELPGGGTAFAKLAIDDATAGYLRAEHRIYSQVEGAFMPRLLGWEDDGEWPLLLLEDLSGAHWPPSWRGGDVEAVLTSLDAVHAAAAPPELPALTRDELHTWREVEADPAPFLSLGLCSPEWLDAVLPELLAATDRVELEGDALLHLDVRSDNLCIHDGRAVLVDWNWAMTGNPAFDVAFWLPSLHMEGGPAPADVLPAAGDMAAVVAGYFAPLVGLPPPEGAPNVRPLQLAQLEVALPWAVEARGLPPLGG